MPERDLAEAVLDKTRAGPAGQAMLLVFPLMCLGYGIGKFITMRRYR